eukprot:861875-Amphidinium_carterae.1
MNIIVLDNNLLHSHQNGCAITTGSGQACFTHTRTPGHIEMESLNDDGDDDDDNNDDNNDDDDEDDDDDDDAALF